MTGTFRSNGNPVRSRPPSAAASSLPARVLEYGDVGLEDARLVGRANAVLGEASGRGPSNVRVPRGIVVTGREFRRTLTANRMHSTITNELADLRNAFETPERIGRSLRESVLGCRLRASLRDALRTWLGGLQSADGSATVSVRGTLLLGEGRESLGVRLDRYYGVEDPEALGDALLGCYASLFDDRNLPSWERSRWDDLVPSVAVVIQEERAESDPLRASGIALTLRTEGEDPTATSAARRILVAATSGGINGAGGLSVDPDRYLVEGPGDGDGVASICRKVRGNRTEARRRDRGFGGRADSTSGDGTGGEYLLSRNAILQVSEQTNTLAEMLGTSVGVWWDLPSTGSSPRIRELQAGTIAV